MFRVELAGAEGLEPSRTVLETAMLPLHHAPKRYVSHTSFVIIARSGGMSIQIILWYTIPIVCPAGCQKDREGKLVVCFYYGFFLFCIGIHPLGKHEK